MHRYSTIKALRTDHEIFLPLVDQQLQEAGVQVITVGQLESEESLMREIADTDLLLMCYTKITANLLAKAKRLKGIVKYGVGIDAIDIETAKQMGIPVVNIPLYAEDTVAEGAFSLMLALAKKFRPLQKAMDNQGWVWPSPSWLGQDLAGKTLGLVGGGKIGQRMAQMAGQGFRMNVLGFDPFQSADLLSKSGIMKVENLQEMLKQCDFVSIHCTLNPKTKHLLGLAELEMMKPSASLINVSRGEIVDEEALVKVLREKKIAGAALDVYSLEPLNLQSHPLRSLFSMENVILSPHLTFYTHEAMERLQRETLERCFEILDSRPVLIKSQDPRLRSQIQGVVFP